MMVTILNVVIDGILTGGIYSLIAMGFGLQYGVARVLNISHGEFIMLGAFATWSLYTFFGINPLISLVICGPVLFGIGFLIHRTLFSRLQRISASTGAYEASSLLATFGILFIIQNAALLIWGPFVRGLGVYSYPVSFAGTTFGFNRLITPLFAIVISVAFYLFISRTRLGKAIRAAAQDRVTAGLMGVKINSVLAVCFGLGALMASLAGSLISITYTISPIMGLEYTAIAFIVVVLGGLGSISGSFIGGFLLGLIGSIVSYFDASLALITYYVIFMLLLMVKPTGILGK
ncbi:MAG: branched-chain amino acid ABC transporter permease [Dehalococcoidales bacterium]|nr:branched-chain amino acid ABC transporter permease [Dehalococcoidales bacterium]